MELRYQVRNGLSRKMEDYLEWMADNGYSLATVESRFYELRHFLIWSNERGIGKAGEITRPILERYGRQTGRRMMKNGQPLGLATREKLLIGVKMFLAWLVKRRELVYNPAADMEMPRRVVKLPRDILSAAEAEQVLNSVDMDRPFSLRDRAMLELLYSTGIRRSELCGLRLRDVDLSRGWLMVCQGKGNKDRVVPVGERAVAWLEKYLWELRPSLLRDAGDDHLFLNRDGNPVRPWVLAGVGHRAVKRAGLEKSGSCHIFRHTMATLMLEGGADIRYIQEILGHESLETTQVYTKVAIGKLKEVHDRTHPGAKLIGSGAKGKNGLKG